MKKNSKKQFQTIIQLLIVGILLTFQNCSEPLPSSDTNINTFSGNVSSNNFKTPLSDLDFKTSDSANGIIKTEFNLNDSIYREVSPLGSDSLVCQTKSDNESACLDLNNFNSMTERGWTYQNISGGKWFKLNVISDSDNLKSAGIFVTFFYDPQNKIIKRVNEFRIKLSSQSQDQVIIETENNGVNQTDTNNNYPSSSLAAQDPGESVPIWKPKENLIVFNPSLYNPEYFIPRCVPTPNVDFHNCMHKSGGFFDTMQVGQVWSMRAKYIDDESNDGSLKFGMLHTWRTETGEAYNSFEISISLEPGDFNVTQGCKNQGRILYYNDKYSTADGRIGKYYKKDVTICPLTSGKRYYFNIRTHNKECGAGAMGCRARLVYYGLLGINMKSFKF